MSDSNKRLGVAIGGAVIGAYFGVPGLGFAVGSLVGGLLFPGPDPDPILGPRLDELLQQTSTYGSFIPYIRGVYRVAGNIIQAADIQEVAKSEKSSAGGKGGGPKQESVSFTYEATFAIGICEGPIAGIRRIWVDDQLYTDLTAPVAGAPINIRVYTGSESQQPDPALEALQGIGNVPAYRGLAYAVVERLNVPGGRIPTIHFEVVVDGAADVIATVITDTGSGGKVAVDPESGLIWCTRGVLGGEVRIFSCDDGFSLVKSIPAVSSSGIAYCPSFVAVTSGLVGPTTNVVPSRMWVASGTPDGLSTGTLNAWRTDGSFKIDRSYSPFGGSLFCWPGAVVVDKSSILQTFPNINPVAVGLVGVTNGACGGIRAFQLNNTIPENSETFVGYNFFGNGYVAGFVEGAKDVIYVISFRGQIYKLQKGVPTFPDPLAEFLAVEYFVTETAEGLDSGLGQLTPQNSITYDPDEDCVYTQTFAIGGSEAQVRKFTSELDVIWTTTYSGFQNFLPTVVDYHEGVGDIWLFGRETINSVIRLHAKRISPEDGRILDDLRTNISNAVNGVKCYPGSPFAVATSNFACLKIPLVPGAEPSPPTLRDVITAYCLKTDRLQVSDLDVTTVPIEDTVTGYAIKARMPIRNALDPLLKAYFVDHVEADGVLRWVKRGGSPVVTIPKEHLAAHSFGSETPSPVNTARTQDNELPREMNLRFVNADDEYKIGVVIAKRLAGGSHQVRTVDFPLVLTPDVAQQIVNTLLFNMWNDRDPLDAIIDRRYLKYTPTDIVNIEHPELGLVEVRLNRVEYHFPQLMKIQGIPEDSSVYRDFTFPAPTTLVTQPTFPKVANLKLFILDIPNLRDGDNDAGVYIGAYAQSGDFQVGEVYTSADGFVFSSAATISNESTVGSMDTTLSWNGSFK